MNTKTQEIVAALQTCPGWPTLAKEAAELIKALSADNERLVEALTSIANNTCCDPCQEARKVAHQALTTHDNAMKEIGE